MILWFFRVFQDQQILFHQDQSFLRKAPEHLRCQNQTLLKHTSIIRAGFQNFLCICPADFFSAALFKIKGNVIIISLFPITHIPSSELNFSVVFSDSAFSCSGVLSGNLTPAPNRQKQEQRQ